VRVSLLPPISKLWTSHENLMKAERRQSAATGRAAWQVRAGPASRRELTALARHLEAEGFSVVRRWRYAFTGANCEDDVPALTDRIRGYSSAGMRIRVQRVTTVLRQSAYQASGDTAVAGMKLTASGIPPDHGQPIWANAAARGSSTAGVSGGRR
jgi:hypothetical protein